MCYNCGCHVPQDTMGNPDNITEQTLAQLSQTLNKPLPQFKQELINYLSQRQMDNQTYESLFAKAATAWGQSIDEAKNNTLKLLQQNLRHS